MNAIRAFQSRLPRSALYTLLLLIIVGLNFSAFSLALSDWNGISWHGNATVFCLNTLPVFLCLGFLWLAFGQAWLACLLTGLATFLLSSANYFKLLFRNTPVLWSDLSNLREGMQMSGEYEVKLTPLMIIWLVVLVAFTLLLALFGRGKPTARVRLLAITVVGMFSLICFRDIYPQNDRYAALVGEYSENETKAYVACGMLYPFLHSASGYADAPASFNKKEMEALLGQYQDADIPQEKQASVIAIQLEAFSDFTKLGIDGISDEVYRDFHALQAESYTGTILTDVFAGGTTETEWAVLTGGNKHHSFDVKTNSAAWYFKEQGYLANGSHPSHRWFYDRENVNPNLGLDDYLFIENHYNQYTDGDVAYDNIFFPDLQQRLDAYFQENDAPLFSFNVTYQGHGPYNTKRTYWGDHFYTGNQDADIRNALNNYFYLIQDTSKHLIGLTDYLNTLQEPVVLMLYGDHKPWMGNQGSFYERLGISLDTTTEEGFRNYYETEYLIWGNKAAKQTSGWDFVGKGPTLSPCFLMNELFAVCGWEGSDYMQAQRETAAVLPVIHTSGWVMENGVLTKTPSALGKSLMQRFQNLSAYDRNRFR